MIGEKYNILENPEYTGFYDPEVLKDDYKRTKFDLKVYVSNIGDFGLSADKIEMLIANLCKLYPEAEALRDVIHADNSTEATVSDNLSKEDFKRTIMCFSTDLVVLGLGWYLGVRSKNYTESLDIVYDAYRKNGWKYIKEMIDKFNADKSDLKLKLISMDADKIPEFKFDETINDDDWLFDFSALHKE